MRFLALCLTLLASCGGIEVETDYDPSTDFAGLTRYAWLEADIPETAEMVQGSLLTHRVHAAADPLLQEKGMEPAPTADADVLVRYSVLVRERLEAWSTGISIGYGHPGPWWSGGPYYTDTTLAVHPETVLILDLVHPQDQRLLWRGTGELNTGRARTPEARTERVRATVAAILAHYPPGIED